MRDKTLNRLNQPALANKKKFLTLILLAQIGLNFVAQKSVAAEAPPVEVESKIAPSGNHYNLFYRGRNDVRFETKRPSQADQRIVLCIPAAFTTFDQKIDGVFVCNGVAGNADKVNNRIGGALKIIAKECTIFPTQAGRLLNASLIDEVSKAKGSLFQQFQVVVSGSGEKFSDKSRFQRRGIALLNDGKLAILESTESITLTQLGTDAAALGVRDLLYTDMGPWSEGWYRNAKGVVCVIGQDRSLTYRQTNWLTFVRPN